MKHFESAKGELSEKRILVTGATGFIGGRLVETLAGRCRAPVRVLARNLTGAFRIARFPIELARGDVTDAEAVMHAAKGRDVIFHCAYGTSGSVEEQRAVNVEGTRNVLEAARKNRAGRVVHVSTVLVYGYTADGTLDESAPRRLLGHVYGDSKLEAENLALGYARRHEASVAVLQPTVVYGPFARIWTEYVLRQLKSGKVMLIDGGQGYCNSVYVDDVVDAMVLAAIRPEADGEAFLISAEQPVTWKDFYQRFERMLGFSSSISVPAAEAVAYYNAAKKEEARTFLAQELWRTLRRDSGLRERLLRTREAALLMRLARFALPANARRGALAMIGQSSDASLSCNSHSEEKPAHPVDPITIRLCQSKTRVSIDKARKLLGYRPRFTFEEGRRLTESWARWSNLLSEQSAVSSEQYRSHRAPNC
jgi:nucleoside-diphosphate-sugar epimerase